MNYRHAFHAGNFADLAKHAAVMLLLDRLLAASGPVRVVDTHAGAGLYDLAGAMAQKSGEAEAGILRLMADGDAPGAFAGLKAAVRRLNPGGPVHLYPGSPRLIAERLRPGDSYVGAELHAEDAAALGESLAPFRRAARAVLRDGYELAAEEATTPPGRAGRLFVLIDPPFERPDDYARAAEAAERVLRGDSQAVIAIWAPLKDLETLDGFVRRLELGVGAEIEVAEVRLNGLDNPLKLNGCAMIFVNAPAGLSHALEPALRWIARQSPRPDAAARLWRTAGSARPFAPGAN